ncbi:CBL-interacting serine/threonine-protein kinase 21 [Modicella reniformis]|uniref:CBL-interacting serine/threonine-protein kinase 21 n=1 Tax=Modicella reniformis TaxID=1440133 RepID=A0A9P6JHH4_9FUNG|nr:CBL-interacting serine/threonine-protein kinase 21 [Modicella reniformis]
MPKSPPSVPVGRSTPPPLVISTDLNSNTPITPAERLELMGPNARTRSYHAHNRSFSYNQAHSHHGNNIFAPDSLSNPNATGDSPSQASLSAEKSLGAGFNPEMTSHGASNILHDPPVRTHSTQPTSKLADQVILDSSILHQDGPSADMLGSTDVGGVASIGLGSGSPASGQRKIYPCLKNTIGPYQLLCSIGQGSFSEVKLAVDARTGDHVAIKVMSKATIQSSDRLGISVQRESDLLKSLQHPNIVGFREVVETSLQMCIVLDYASGGELFVFVEDKRAQASEQDIQYIFAQIVDAVDYLHRHNIVHRDLKLENVLLEPRTGAPLRPTVKLTDFGLAKVIEEDAPQLTTRCGSEDYAAPEIILGQSYDGREADIWSLGVVLYALLVGFLPFNMRPGMDRKSFLSMIAQAEFGFPGEKVSFTRASLLSLRQRSLSTASTASSTSTIASTVATTAGNDYGVASAVGILLPAVTPDTPSASEGGTTTVTVPKKRGVNPVSDEAKELVRWLLQTQGSKRPTSRELREHPWVVAGREAVAEAHSK